MLVIFFRSIILYILVLLSLRIMGKGEIAEMNCFDLVVTLLIADVVSVSIENNSIPILYSFAAITGIAFLQISISFLGLKNKKVSAFLSGSPSILIEKGKINQKSLKKERITIDELLEQLRVNGYFNINDVSYAILETDGQLSILPKPSYNDIPKKEYNHLPTSLILDGVVMKENLSMVNKNMHWLSGVLNAHHIKSVDEVLLLVLDGYDKVFIQKK